MLETARQQAYDGGDGVERSEASAVNKAEHRSLYKKREKIYPKKVSGTYRRLKWVILVLTLAVYYLAPWIRWDRGPSLPDQAILIDIPARRFYFFFIEIWPQEVYYLTGLLILAALALFLVTTLAGRVWCGYSCPQTVWTDLFVAVERFIEGDRSAQMRLDASPWKAAKLGKKALKHVAWLLIAAATGGAWVFYFADAPTILVDVFTLDAPPVAYITIAVLTGSTYLFGGHAREQVCTYMCPWPRIQAAMLDEDSLTVTYRDFRGEPRGPRRKNKPTEHLGDCIDCNQCVAVCPMGIDIRDGQQLECITCALCIDACDNVMDRVGLPQGLIAYDTLSNVDQRAHGGKTRVRLLRPRSLLYIGIILLVGVIMLISLISRSAVDINVLRDRNPLFVTLSDGSIRNGYTVKILNKDHSEKLFRLSLQDMADAGIQVVGSDPAALTVKSDRLASFRVFVTLPKSQMNDESLPFTFVVTDLSDDSETRHDSVFRGPGK
ncbi:cytochrome c oxidase accessory protein CcoG [Pelagibius sp. Alg239-R121]|uniref:cytochrome c oxidase accessory protein CcoG n=1 Tax=Pelagibius sp. Alg239-R121 TaxID=2993448 RepID=UPI0024A7680E|nr:cytochrome c oxidase accessory protein CcoG [Pelagibius sp. Alg239-R121]